MNLGSRTVLKNASVMMATQIFTWVLALLLTLFLPRYLGAAGSGQYHLATSIWAIVGVVAAFGIDAFIIKEVARTPERTGDLLFNAVLIRSVLFLLGFGFALLYSRAANYPELTFNVILVVGLSSFLAQISATIQAFLQGLERMEFISLAQVLERTLVTLGSIALLLLGFGVLEVAAAAVVGSIMNLLIQFSALRRLQKLRLAVDIHLIRWILKSSLPFLLFSSFIVIYGQIDTLLISLLVDEKGVGWYSVTDRLYGTFLFIPTIFITAVFPALSRMFVDENDSFLRLGRKSFDLMVLLAVPIGLGVFLIAGPFVVLLFGPEFDKSGPILTLRGINLIFTYLNMLLGVFLISVDKQKAWTIVIGLATALTIPLDFLLIPLCEQYLSNGAMGGAFSYLITESGMLAAGLLLLPKGFLTRANSRYALRVFIAGMAMVVLAWWSRDLFIAVPIALGAAIYAAFLVILRVLTKEDWDFFRTLSGYALQRLKARSAQPAAGIHKG